MFFKYKRVFIDTSSSLGFLQPLLLINSMQGLARCFLNSVFYISTYVISDSTVSSYNSVLHLWGFSRLRK